MIENAVVIITEHAYDRAKERLGWKPKTLDRIAGKALSEGIKHSESKGTLNKYVTKVWFSHRNANNVRIYGEVIYIFCENILITLYHLPTNLRKHVRYSKQKQ